jgi:23S rRNA (adenine2503-C2)-methyltransferase
MTSSRDSLHDYRPDIADLLTNGGEPAFRAAQVYEHLMHHPGLDFTAATALSKGLRGALHELGETTVSLVTRQDDPDGTTKLLLRAPDASLFETVIMRYRRRSTVCVSSQVGCAMGCVFCSTGGLGFRRNLTTAEIVDQVRTVEALLVGEGRHVDRVVYMGMGEPLLNPDAVLASIALLRDPAGLGMAQRSLSVSTVGIPAGIRRLAAEAPQVNLALSLHAADDTLRAHLMPVGRKYGLHEVMKAVEDHFDRTHRKLFVEYLLLAGVNDSVRQAHALADLVRGRVVTVNLIPWNPGCGDFTGSTPEVVESFRTILLSRGIETTVRERRGQSIAAACGQLAAGPRAGSGAGRTAARDTQNRPTSSPSQTPNARRNKPAAPDPARKRTRDGR